MSAIRIGAMVGVLVVLLASASSTVQTANLTMATPARVSQSTSAIDAAVLAPPGCAAIAAGLTVVRVATGNSLNAGNQANLAIGRNADTTINGQGGHD